MKAPRKMLSKLTIISCFVLLSFGLRAQHIGTPLPPSKSMTFASFSAPDLQLDVVPALMKTPIFSPHWRSAPFNSKKAGNILRVIAVINSFSNHPTPFFCRIEENLEKSARFPVRFRLGDLNYVDRLEQKRDWDLNN